MDGWQWCTAMVGDLTGVAPANTSPADDFNITFMTRLLLERSAECAGARSLRGRDRLGSAFVRVRFFAALDFPVGLTGRPKAAVPRFVLFFAIACDIGITSMLWVRPGGAFARSIRPLVISFPCVPFSFESWQQWVMITQGDLGYNNPW